MQRKHNLLVLSDVHLGSDLVHHSRPDAPERADSSLRRDRDLAAMLEWYREHRVGKKPWRLVIAGDFVDFVGMSVSVPQSRVDMPGDALDLTEEERAHGLGGAVEHAVLKLQMVGTHHAEVFASLARFVADGNLLVVVRGNHDVDFHWEPVQREFLSLLSGHAPLEQSCVEFAPWFYYEEGEIFIEHGHQYDSFCSYENVMHPVSPRDPRRSSRSISDVLLRYVVRPTRGMRESGHDDMTIADYLRFGARLGATGMLALARRFFGALGALFAIWRYQFGGAADWVRQEHDRKMRLLAEARQISESRLRALAKLQRPPATKSLLMILASVMLDRIVVAVLGLALVVAVFYFTPTFEYATLAAVFAASLAAGLGIAWARARGPLDASGELRDCAPRVARLFPAAFVVMGHTHLPEVRQDADAETTYVNLGAWAEEDSEDGCAPALPATRTHLVVQSVDGELVAELMKWGDAGPERFQPGYRSGADPTTA